MTWSKFGELNDQRREGEICKQIWPIEGLNL